MNRGQIRERILKRSVYKHIRKKEAGITFADCGRDYASVRLSDEMSLVEASGTSDDVRSAWMVARNKILTAFPDNCTVSMLMMVPEDDPESYAKNAAIRLRELSDRDGIPVTSIDTQVLTELEAPVYTIRFSGVTTADRTGGTFPADTDLVMIGHAGHMGSLLLSNLFDKELTARFGSEFTERASNRLAGPELADVAQVIETSDLKREIIAIKDVSEGGIYGALYDLADEAGIGLAVRRSDITILQETVEYAEYFGINPYNLLGSGAWIIGTPDGVGFAERLRNTFAAHGIERPVSVIGRTTTASAKVIEESTRSLTPSEGDELYSMMRKRSGR